MGGGRIKSAWRRRPKDPRAVRQLKRDLHRVNALIHARMDVRDYDWKPDPDWNPDLLPTIGGASEDEEPERESLFDVRHALIGRLEALLNPSDGVLLYKHSDFDEACKIVAPDFEAVSSDVNSFVANKPNYIHELHWRQLEEVIAGKFRELGYETQLGPGRGDGGVDIRVIHKAPLLGDLLVLVQVKKYRPDRKIGLEAVAALYGTVEAEEANKGVFITTSAFLPGARKFADERRPRLLLVDEPELRNWLMTSGLTIEDP